MGDINFEFVDLLKEIRDYIVKQDAEQERAKIDKPPKVQETQKHIKGATMPGSFKPSPGVAKQMIRVPKEGSTLAEIGGSPTETVESSLLKEEELEEGYPTEATPASATLETEEDEVGEEVEEIPEDLLEEEETSASTEEIKSLLKDIKTLLAKNTLVQNELADIKKSMSKEIEKGVDLRMRKAGFVRSRAPITKLGIAKEDEIKKSSEEKASSDLNGVLDIVDDLSRKSWNQLAELRIAAGDLKPFSPYIPVERK